MRGSGGVQPVTMIQLKNIINDLAKHPTLSYSHRDLAEIKYLTVHHFGSKTLSIQQAASYHVSKGWPGISYTICIDFDGVAYLTNHLDTKSYGVANMNTVCLSIALRGNWSDELPHIHQLDTLERVIGILKNVIGGGVQVMVHSDFVNTECPGEALRAWVRRKYPQPEAIIAPVPALYAWLNKLFNRDRGHV